MHMHAYTHMHTHSLPIRILKELLQTYTDSDADEAQDLAEELIMLVISDPCTFVFDDLHKMAPVEKLEGRKSHKVCASEVECPKVMDNYRF